MATLQQAARRFGLVWTPGVTTAVLVLVVAGVGFPAVRQNGSGGKRRLPWRYHRAGRHWPDAGLRHIALCQRRARRLHDAGRVRRPVHPGNASATSRVGQRGAGTVLVRLPTAHRAADDGRRSDRHRHCARFRHLPATARTRCERHRHSDGLARPCDLRCGGSSRLSGVPRSRTTRASRGRRSNCLWTCACRPTRSSSWAWQLRWW